MVCDSCEDCDDKRGNPVHTYTSFRIKRTEKKPQAQAEYIIFRQSTTKKALRQTAKGLCFAVIFYSRTYFRMKRTVSTYMRGLIFFSLALPVTTLTMVQEMTPMAMPSEML